MAQPILYQIKSWDATKDGAISFSYNGNQVFKNQVIIRSNATNEIVYDQTQTSFQLKHIISSNSIANNICYNVQVRVFDKDDAASSWSQIELFYCFNTPVFSFDSVVENQIIQNSAFEARLLYEQVGDPINYYQFFLYDEQKVKLGESITMYGNQLKYIYSGLEDNKKYFIRATGESLNKMALDTGHVGVSVQYIVPSLYAIVDLANIADQGLVRIHSNIISIEGKSNPSPLLFTNGMADLTEDNSWILFDEGFEISGNFTLQINASEMIVNKSTLILSDGKKGNVFIKCMNGQVEYENSNNMCFALRAVGLVATYVQFSNYISPASDENHYVNLWIRRVNNVYEVKAIIKEKESVA